MRRDVVRSFAVLAMVLAAAGCRRQQPPPVTPEPQPQQTPTTVPQELLAAKVPVSRANPPIRIRIEGHADERGSVEYNLALGMRRANAVRDYLADFGIEASRFDVVSFGEDRPAATGSSETVWSR